MPEEAPPSGAYPICIDEQCCKFITAVSYLIYASVTYLRIILCELK